MFPLVPRLFHWALTKNRLSVAPRLRVTPALRAGFDRSTYLLEYAVADGSAGVRTRDASADAHRCKRVVLWFRHRELRTRTDRLVLDGRTSIVLHYLNC